MKIAVITAATKSYSYALRGSIMAVKRALAGHEYTHFLATDKSGVAKAIAETTDAPVRIVEVPVDDSKVKYKQESQMLISTLQQACLDAALQMDADLCWSVESDIIVHQNSFPSLRWVLNCPEPRYDIAVSTYFNGSFLCGRGTPYRQICEDFADEERDIPEELREKIAKKRSEFSEFKESHPSEMVAEMQALEKQARECPPRGNVFEMNAKKWRRRGWLENAYPGASVYGAVLPTDWCGMGCTLLSKKALKASNFDGYEGHGTQDLHLVWSKWYPAGMRIGLNVSVPAIHVKKADSEIIAWTPYFSADEETCGHLRVARREYRESYPQPLP